MLSASLNKIFPSFLPCTITATVVIITLFCRVEPEPCADEDDEGGGQPGEGAHPPGAPRHAGALPRARQELHPRAHQRRQDLHHRQAGGGPGGGRRPEQPRLHRAQNVRRDPRDHPRAAADGVRRGGVGCR